jgi:hypothetical protein
VTISFKFISERTVVSAAYKPGVLNLFVSWGYIPPFLSNRGPQFINEENLLKLRGSLLKVLLTYRFTHYSITLFNEVCHL